MIDNAPVVPAAAEGRAADRISAEARRRRTFAVISHPDAGKSTLTEALVLHANAITEAGAIHGKAGRRATVSDWMDMEKARGISITSTALQFPYESGGRDCVINLLDTPGHADFSEDTYRVLTAVDCAVMLIDAAKGLEPQTLKLFQVCRHRRIPIITVINKWDRPGRDPLELMDEIAARINLQPTPLTWPVGIAGDFKGVLDRRTGNYIRFTRTAGGAKAAPEEHIAPDAAHDAAGIDWDRAVEESDLLEADGADYDRETFLGCESTPVLFTSAALNFGVNQLLDVLVAARTAARRAARRRRQPTGDGVTVQCVRVQGPGRHGLRAPRPHRLRTGVFGHLRTRRGPHPCHDGQAVRHQVRAIGVRPATVHPGHRVAGRRDRAGQRRSAAAR